MLPFIIAELLAKTVYDMMALRDPGWDDAPGHAEADGHHQDRGLGGLPHQEPGQPEYFTHSSSCSAGTPIPSSPLSWI